MGSFKPYKGNKVNNKQKNPYKKYNVIIPNDLQEVGIKGKNLSRDELQRLMIDPESITSGSRTTIMIKNIPNKYTQEQLIRYYLDLTHKGKFNLITQFRML